AVLRAQRPVPILNGKRVTLGVCGSIAAFKAVGLASTLHQAGALVDVAMTADAQRFIQPLSFQAITHRPVFADLWAPGMETDIAHVTLGRESDVIVVAPAMDAGMYTHPATVANVATLRERGVIVVEPETGHLASGLSGLGRLAAPETIFDAIRAALGTVAGDLPGVRVLVTAGGTQEAIDPVRFIGNHSSGKMGYAIAEAARDRGARVVLVTTPTALRTPAGLEVIAVHSAAEMLKVLTEQYARLDVLIMTAAVADFRVEASASQKLK